MLLGTHQIAIFQCPTFFPPSHQICSDFLPLKNGTGNTRMAKHSRCLWCTESGPRASGKSQDNVQQISNYSDTWLVNHNSTKRIIMLLAMEKVTRRGFFVSKDRASGVLHSNESLGLEQFHCKCLSFHQVIVPLVSSFLLGTSPFKRSCSLYCSLNGELPYSTKLLLQGLGRCMINDSFLLIHLISFFKKTLVFERFIKTFFLLQSELF